MPYYEHATMLALRLGPWARARSLRPHEAESDEAGRVVKTNHKLKQSRPMLRQIRAVLRLGK